MLMHEKNMYDPYIKFFKNQSCISFKNGFVLQPEKSQPLHMYVNIINEPRHEKTGVFAYAKTKTQISFTVTAKLISAFVFATRIVQFLYFLSL